MSLLSDIAGSLFAMLLLGSGSLDSVRNGYDFFAEYDANLQCSTYLQFDDFDDEVVERHILWTGNFVLGYVFAELDDGSMDQLEMFRLVEDLRTWELLRMWTRCEDDPEMTMLDIARTVSDELRAKRILAE